MKRLFKKFVTLVLAAATLSTTAAFAQNEMTNMKFVGYDASDMLNPYYVYNEVVNDKYTGKQVLVRVEDEDIKWVTNENCYEADYPYAGYSVMYIANPETKAWDNTWVTAYNNTNPQWQTRRADWVFELAAPYYIWERQQTNTAFAGWKWDYANEKFGIEDSALVKKTSRTAKNVKVEWIDYGFARYDNNGVILDAYKTYADIHCDDCDEYSIGCAKCATLIPVKYWSKEDTDMYATQKFFGVLEEAVTGDGVAKAISPAAIVDLVQYVRACNIHVAKCPVSENCTHDYHKAGLTLAGVLAANYGIQGWDELVAYVLTPANLAARGNIAQSEAYDRAIYGNLLKSEGKNKYYITDDVIAELVPMIKAKKVTASFKEDSALITKVAVEEYVKSETAKIDFAKAPNAYYNALVDNKTAWDWSNVDALDVVYNTAKIEWTTPNFEAAPPHKYYQYMVLDGVVLNGADKKPLVWRYTGANADPVVEWKFDSFKTVVDNNVEENTLGLYAAVERFYVNGVKTDIIRIPAVAFAVNSVADWAIHNEAKADYAYAYFKASEDGKYTDYYITDNNGVNILVYRQVNYGTLYNKNINPNTAEKEDGAASFGVPTIVTATVK